jgi:hypothetical protein
MLSRVTPDRVLAVGSRLIVGFYNFGKEEIEKVSFWSLIRVDWSLGLIYLGFPNKRRADYSGHAV